MSAKKTARDCRRKGKKQERLLTRQVRVYTRERTTGPAGAKAAAETASAATTADRSIVQDGQGNGEFSKVGTGIFVPSFHFRTNAVPGTDSKKLINLKVTCFGNSPKRTKRDATHLRPCCPLCFRNCLCSGRTGEDNDNSLCEMQNEMTLDRNEVQDTAHRIA